MIKELSPQFPSEFLFGSGTSAYQVEDNSNEPQNADYDSYLEKHRNDPEYSWHGRRPNWWDFEEFRTDITLLKGIGLNSQRLSFAWNRIFPDRDTINFQAIAQYRRMVDLLQENDMTPVVTANHYILPTWIADQGGWANPETVKQYRNYAKTLATHFSDVPYWIPINEPNALSVGGYYLAIKPPEKTSLAATIPVTHNLARAHKVGYEVIKDLNPETQIGTAQFVSWFKPDNPRSSMDRVITEIYNRIFNLRDLHLVQDYMDFVGVNFYCGYNIRFSSRAIGASMQGEALNVPKNTLAAESVKPSNRPESDTGWPFTADYLMDALKTIDSRFHRPIIITENGIADKEDSKRAAYIRHHLQYLLEGIRKGIDIRGYFYWSSVDSLEYSEGLRSKFGLIGIDNATGAHFLKPSAYEYGRIASSGDIT